MAKKYSEADLKKIRKDIPIALEELKAVQDELKKANGELAFSRAETKSAELATEAERSKVSLIWDSVARKLQLTQAVNDSLTKENREVSEKLNFAKAQLTLMQGLLHDTIVRLTAAAKREPRGMVADLLKVMQDSLRSVIRQRDSEKETLARVQAERANLEKSVEALEAQAAGFAGKVDEKAVVETQLAAAREELANSDAMIKAIKERDHDSQVMALRLTEEYKATYFKEQEKG